MDLYTRAIKAAVDHWPLVAGIAAVAYWLFPKMLRDTLSNGGGDIIRRIMREENAAQTVLHNQHLEDRFKKHEAEEERRFSRIEDEVFRRRSAKR